MTTVDPGIRDRIARVLATTGDDTKRAELILAIVADWLPTAHIAYRLGLAITAATPERWPHGDDRDDLTTVTWAVTKEIAAAIRAEAAKAPEGVA